MHSNANFNSAIAELVLENTHPLVQLTDLLRELSPGQFTARCNSRQQHTIGKHVRHIIDHYSVFLSGVESSAVSIDYERRLREEVLEEQPQASVERILQLCKRLQQLGNTRDDAPLRLAHTTDQTTVVMNSSVSRELGFLASHSIHHMAIIALLAEQLGLETSLDFGVHPSTLRYLQRQELAPAIDAKKTFTAVTEVSPLAARSN